MKGRGGAEGKEPDGDCSAEKLQESLLCRQDGEIKDKRPGEVTKKMKSGNGSENYFHRRRFSLGIWEAGGNCGIGGGGTEALRRLASQRTPVPPAARLCGEGGGRGQRSPAASMAVL